MPRLWIAVDERTVFDENVAGWQLPPQPDLIGPAVRAQAQPNVKPPPFLKALMLAMVGKAVDQALHDPRLAPLDVTLATRSTGWTITVDIPVPTASDVQI